MTNRKFYKTIITIEVLTETPIMYSMSMADISREIEGGDFSGKYETIIENEVVDGKIASEILLEHGSDTEFFLLDEDGNDIDY